MLQHGNRPVQIKPSVMPRMFLWTTSQTTFRGQSRCLNVAIGCETSTALRYSNVALGLQFWAHSISAKLVKAFSYLAINGA
jgi:hypothetical protein